MRKVRGASEAAVAAATGLTFHSDLAVAVGVASGEESLGLLLAERSGGGREVLQEEPGRRKQGSFQWESHPPPSPVSPFI